MTVNEILVIMKSNSVVEGRQKLLSLRPFIDQKRVMNNEYSSKNGNTGMSPLSATTKIPTRYLLNYLSQYESASYKVGELLRSREETIVYQTDAVFRGDPYPGALAAIDYLLCRQGTSFEERRYNLVHVWGSLAVDDDNETIVINGSKGKINDFVSKVADSEKKNILKKKKFSQLKNSEIPRYYMQVRYGSSFSKAKHIRVYAYFADAILFADGALWRDA